MLLTRNGVQSSEPKSPFATSSRKIFWSTSCENGWSHVKYKENKCEVRWLSSVTVVHGLAGTWNKGISQSISSVTCVWESVKDLSAAASKVMSPEGSKLVKSACEGSTEESPAAAAISGRGALLRIKLSRLLTLSSSEERGVVNGEFNKFR